MVRIAPGSGFTLVNRTTTTAAGTPENIEYRRPLDGTRLEVSGTIPMLPPADSAGAQVRTATRQVAVVNPTVFFVQSFKDELIAAGIRVTGEAMDLDDVPLAERTEIEAGGTRRLLVKSDSPPLREIAVVLMKVSQNLYAETLLKASGVAAGKAGTVEAGREAVQNALRDWKIDGRSLVMADGSGLSRYNYVSAALLTDILTHLWQDPTHRDAFAATLPVAGKDGTVAARMRRSRAEGNAMAKTGSISNVRSLSGYVRTRDGELLTFSILANDFVVPAAMVNWIADLAVEVLSNFTRPAARRHDSP
jgi:serine-type D-Ala-D-Ala carboxypeptidase/endopeptidase (penicillin-binding protein 4)